MLIPSPRHTQADLELWAELEEADLLHYQNANVEAKAKFSIEAIQEFVKYPCYCSVSWGKDSVVVAHMAASFRVPFVWVRWAGADNPDSESVSSHFEHRQAWAPIGDHEDGRGGWAAAVKLMGTKRRIAGIRADESSSRRLSAAAHGVATCDVCRPILRWSVADVFAYLAFHRLPVHPAYAMLGGGRWPRDRLRVDVIGDSRGAGGGRREWEMEYYGDVLRRMEAGA